MKQAIETKVGILHELLLRMFFTSEVLNIMKGLSL